MKRETTVEVPSVGDIGKVTITGDPAFVEPLAQAMALEVIGQDERELDVLLGPEDLARHGRELVNLLGEIEEEEEDQVAQKAEMKTRLAEMHARQSKLAGMIRRGIEKRSVEVEVLADWTTQTAIVRRRDTGEELERRPLRESEKQLRLVPAVAEAAAAATVEHGEA